MATLLGVDKRRTLVVVIAAVVLLGSLASVVLRVVRDRAWQAQAQSEQTQMYGPDGRDIRRPMKSLDEMYDYVGVRVQQEVAASYQHHLSREERTEHYHAIFKAMGDEIKRVTDSHYTKTFDRSAIESEYRHILWVDRIRADSTAVAPFLALGVLSGAITVSVIRYCARLRKKHAL